MSSPINKSYDFDWEKIIKETKEFQRLEKRIDGSMDLLAMHFDRMMSTIEILEERIMKLENKDDRYN